ncbi:DDE-type integrase/transposase/recombinase [Microvirga sp. GCM10011540]|uniref:DDE-type integrase/transposase/recombinase n=1 Tax=Microvirga sp. GCM10011540 TaxID=3317338 RepID=UPI00360DE7A1
MRKYQGSRSGSWHVDETYVRVGGGWKYLFCAVDKHGQQVGGIPEQPTASCSQALRTMSDYPPWSITTDVMASYPRAIRRLRRKGLLSREVDHRTSKYLNNIIGADHRALKRVIQLTRGF